MTVEELVEKLKEAPEDLLILVKNNKGDYVAANECHLAVAYDVDMQEIIEGVLIY